MQPDKQKHFIIGAVMGIFFGVLGIWGLLIGWLIIVGWEVQQALFNTGTPELLDIVYGGVPFTVLWFIGYFVFRRK